MEPASHSCGGPTSDAWGCHAAAADPGHVCPCRGDPAAGELAGVAAQQLLLVDFCLLEGAMAACDRLLLQGHGGAGSPAAAAAGPEATAAALLHREMLAAVRRSDDCVRKPLLARWLLGGGSGA